MAILKYKGTTLVEVLVSLTLISISITLILFLFSQVPASLNVYQKIEASIITENIVQNIIQNKKIPEVSFDSDNIKIEIAYEPFCDSDDLTLIIISAHSKLNKLIYLRKLVIKLE